MTDAFTTMIVPASLAPAARAIAAALSPAGHGMFIAGLSLDGSELATHYVSTGKIDARFAAILAMHDGAALDAAAQAGAQAQGLPVTWTADDCAVLLDESDVSADEPFAAFARMGLQLVQEVE